jgi:dolichol-phosphate mannosyltransferase
MKKQSTPQQEMDGLLSVILPIHQFTAELADRMDAILVDDGSPKEQADWIPKYLADQPGIRYIRLSRSFGLDVAVSAGLEAAIGDICLVMQPELDPPHLIPEFVNTCREHGGIVLGRLNLNKQSFISKHLGKVFHFLTKNLFAISLPERTTHFIATDRNSVMLINKTKDKDRYLRAITTHIGIPTRRIDYTPLENSQRKVRSLLEAVNLGIDVITMNSVRPLRLVSLAAFAIGLMNLVYVIYIFGSNWFRSDVASGWPTLSLQLASGFFILLTGLSVLLEYVGRILRETANRPLYYIANDLSSRTPVGNSEQKNILEHSVNNDESKETISQ